MKSATGFGGHAAVERALTPTVSAALGVRAAPPNSLRLKAAAAHVNGSAAGAPPLPPAPDNDAGSDGPLRTIAVITGGVDGACEPVSGAGAPVPAGVGVDGGEDSVPVLPRDVMFSAAEISARSRRREPGPLPLAPVDERAVVVEEEPSVASSPGLLLDEPRSAAEPSARSGRRGPDPLPVAPVDEPAFTEDEPSLVEEPLLADPRCVAARDDEPSELEPLEPVEPPEPVVSAKAIGAEAIAAPTPSATANAPTRPTLRA